MLQLIGGTVLVQHLLTQDVVTEARLYPYLWGAIDLFSNQRWSSIACYT